MTRKYLIIGFLGYTTNQLDGQTVKSRAVYKLLKNNFFNVEYFDTQKVHFSKTSILDFVKKFISSDVIIIIPGSNSIKKLFPLTYWFSKLLRKDLHCIPVGGWLPETIQEKRFLEPMFRNIKSILPQTLTQVSELKTIFNYENVFYFPNFRFCFNTKDCYEKKSLCHRIVFFSRIDKMKGLDYIFSLAEYIYSKDLHDSFEIDFYGPIMEDSLNYFNNQLRKYSNITKYLGELQPRDITTTLSYYDLLVLPTKYYTEGFPGAILDAYLAGVPVLVTEWKHAHEFVVEGKTGFIIPFNCSYSIFIEKCMEILKDKELLIKMRRDVKKFSLNFSEYSAIEILKNVLKR